MIRPAIATSILALLLAGCDGSPSEERPAPTPTPTPSATASEPVSIIRPDIEEAADIPLEPLDVTIGFPDGGSALDDKALAALSDLMETRQQREGVPIVLRGHSDAGGRDEVNLRVSRQRAEAVRDWLVENGVAEDRITLIAFGEQNPVAPNALPDGSPNEKGRERNRRVEISLVVPEGTMVRPESQPATPSDRAAQQPAG